MNFVSFKKYLIITSILLCFISNTSDQKIEPIVDPREADDVDFSFYKDPYLAQQEGVAQVQLQEDISDSGGAPIVDISEAEDVDFSYFNDPYAFETFNKQLPIKAKFSGYVQYSSWWDSRQVCAVGDGYALLFPLKAELDVNGCDINAHGDFNMTMIETRVKAEFFGPKILSAETFAYIEADVFGEGIVINRWRIRHAFARFTWKHAKVLLGQFWHPMFVVKTFPLLVSFDGGIPIQPFSRNPQIRVSMYNNRGTELLVTAASQLEFISNGPIGFSSTYLRNARIPDLTVRLTQQTKHNYVGCGFNFMRLKPRLESNNGFKVHESINSFRFFAFNTFQVNPLEIRTQLTYAQNATNLAMLGGYAVSSVNPLTDERTYTNISALAYWLDINIDRKIEPGFFIGIIKNLGASNNIIQCIKNPMTGIEEPTIYELPCSADQVDTVFKAAPRVRFHVLPVDFAAELEYTRAGFGCINDRARIERTDPVSNTRIIFTAYYYF